MIRAFLRRLLRDRVAEWWDGHDHAEQRLRDYHHRPEAERIIDGDEPHCPDCVIAWDNRADRCGLIPCDIHRPRGRHHAEPLTYSPVPPSVHDISSLGEWK